MFKILTWPTKILPLVWGACAPLRAVPSMVGHFSISIFNLRRGMAAILASPRMTSAVV